MLQWRIGIERSEPPSEMLETVVALTREGRRVWRVTHYPVDPAESDRVAFDSYDVDASTSTPIRSVMRNPGFELSLLFEPGLALLHRTAQESTVSERIVLKDSVKPEGPGHRVFLAGLPLKPGYTLKYQIVDRWSGKEQSRVKEMTLSVPERRQIKTALGAQDVLIVLINAVDGSFQITEQVRAEPPHYPFRVEYVRGKSVLVSDVTTMAIDSLTVAAASRDANLAPSRARGNDSLLLLAPWPLSGDVQTSADRPDRTSPHPTRSIRGR